MDDTVGIALLAVGVTAVLAGLVVAVPIAWMTTPRRGLRSLGYVRRRNGIHTRVIGDVEVAWKPPRRWSVRIGVYMSLDFVAVAWRGAPDPHERPVGQPAIDRRFRVTSTRRSQLEIVLAQPDVVAAMIALPASRITLNGDELVVEVRRPRHWMHDGVLRLARALAATAPMIRPL